MARVGKKNVAVPSGVQVTEKNGLMSFKGSKGSMSFDLHSALSFEMENGQISLKCAKEIEGVSALQGTFRQLVFNAVKGVSEGFERSLNLQGIGYRAQVEGNDLVLNLGYSHEIKYNLPEQVTAQVQNSTKIILSSCDKAVLGQTAAEIRAFRPPEPYKGKGILYEGERIRRKVGKSGKK